MNLLGSVVVISRGGYGEKEGPKYGGPISFIMIDVRDAVYCTCRWVLQYGRRPPHTLTAALNHGHKYNTTTCTIPLGQVASNVLILAIYIVNSLNSW